MDRKECYRRTPCRKFLAPPLTVINDKSEGSAAKHYTGMCYFTTNFVTLFANERIFLNRRTFGEVANKSMAYCFLTHGVICCITNYQSLSKYTTASNRLKRVTSLHCKIQGGPKNRTVFRLDNFVTVSPRKACSMSKFSQFYGEKRYKTRISVSLNILCQICSNRHNS